MARKRVAVLISGRGSNMVSLIEAAKAPDYPAEIALVVSNRPDAAGLELARKAGVSTLVIDHRPHGKDRAAFERVLQHALDEQRIEFICLGGFMRLFTAEFVLHWQGRMLNIHPSLLPSFPGLDPHGQALRAGVRISGATVHFVIPETDAGPIIAQAAVPVREGDTADTIAARVLAVEHRIYPLALKLVAEGRVRIVDGRCTVEGARAPDGFFMMPQD
jgi:phosphoribosylglycinamide formyltransferase 1